MLRRLGRFCGGTYVRKSGGIGDGDPMVRQRMAEHCCRVRPLVREPSRRV